MYFICLLLALINLIFCWSRVIGSHKNKRIFVFIWVMLLYFSILMIVSLHGELRFTEGFSGNVVEYSYRDVAYIYLFVLAGNFFIAVGQLLSEKTVKLSSFSFAVIGKRNVVAVTLTWVLLVLFLIGALLFYKQSQGIGYAGFVEYEGSNWGLVLLYSSSSLICILLMRGKYVAAAAVVSVFVYFAIVLQIRSFFIFSIFVVLSILYLKYWDGTLVVNGRRNGFKAIAFIILLLMLSINFVISYAKTGEFVFPESGLVNLMIHVIYKLSNGYELTGFDSIERFLYGLYKPIAAVVGYAPNLSEDVQVYFSRLVFGFESWDVFFHYPSLWYSDAYSSFGFWGVLFGLFWGYWFSTLEKIIRCNKVIFSLFLPLFLWNMYMVMRGAVGNSTAAISYAIYINLALYFIGYFVAMSLASGNGKRVRISQNE